ncbi:sensor histidine kinase [Actinomadura rupiterrae]|uniref:sensor histidine kinase n=1 Tax=Actinomadura rupiterrae TaxID=559627 RepID=UPI0020A4317D|nr:histidine kinase [Actinomadura rupiterrae]MCP2338667.1 signal transduction histidine kinase [Actinomadura rupiterrae]
MREGTGSAIFSASRTRLAPTAGLAALFLAATAVQAAAIGTSWGASYWPFDAAMALAVCALSLLTHTSRGLWAAGGTLAVAAVAVLIARVLRLPAEPSPAMTLGLAVAIVRVVRTFPPVPAGVVAGGGLAVALGGEIASRTSSGGSSVANMNLIGWFVAVVAGLALRRSAARAQAAMERVRRDERLALAREMHDVVAHHIASMLIQTQAAQIVARRRPEDMPRTLAGIETAGADALAAMRRAVGVLRESGEAAPLAPGPERLDDLVGRFGRTGPPVRLHMPEDDRDWPPEVAGTVYRIVREALTNVARHAPGARSVAVTVRRDGPELNVEVVDDAPSARARGRGGYGLLGMRERVEALGGTLAAGPEEHGGWSVRAVLPMPAGGA